MTSSELTDRYAAALESDAIRHEAAGRIRIAAVYRAEAHKRRILANQQRAKEQSQHLNTIPIPQPTHAHA